MFKLFIESKTCILISQNDTVYIHKLYSTYVMNKILSHQFAGLVYPTERKKLKFSFKTKEEAIEKAKKIINFNKNIEKFK